MLLATVAAGCASLGESPGDRSPPLEVPAAWEAGAPEGRVEPWLAAFDDPALTHLVAEAMAGNFELQGTAHRVRAAHAQARIAGAGLQPQVQVTGDASRSERNSAGEAGFSGKNPSTSFELRGQLSWEADLWGRLSDGARAARADAQAVESDYAAARLSLAANIARAWFDVIEARAQTRLARDTVSSFERSLETIERRYRQGIGEALDVRLARNNLAAAQANLSQRERVERSLTRGLETLLGRYPAGALAPHPSLPDVSKPVPAGLPAGLLERRPDLLAAGARLRAAGYRVSEAEKNRLPGITLTAGGGTSSDALRNLLDPDFLIWTLVANLAQPVFQGGRLEAERNFARARDHEALSSFAQTALTAFREVENALDSTSFLVDQETATRTAAEEARAAESLALDQYRRGLTGIITLLESQRRRFNAESALIEVINLKLQNRINLHLALGGDFAPPADGRTASAE